MEIENFININECTKLERNVYEFFDAFEGDISDYSAEKIAYLCRCSPATINRFFTKCGYQGYADFKFNSYHNNDVNRLFQIEQDTTTMDLFSKQLLTSEKILVFGFGSSYISAQYLYNKLVKLNLPAIMINDRYDLSRIEHDTAIIISNTGESRAIISILNSDYDQDKILSITKKASPLCFHSKASLTHNTEMIVHHSNEHDEQIHLLHLIYQYEKHLKQYIKHYTPLN